VWGGGGRESLSASSRFREVGLIVLVVCVALWEDLD